MLLKLLPLSYFFLYFYNYNYYQYLNLGSFDRFIVCCRWIFLFLFLGNAFIIITVWPANAEKAANINANINNLKNLKNIKSVKIVADLRPIYFLIKDLIEGAPAELILIEEGEEALHGHGFALKPNELYFIQNADLLVTYNDYKGENYKIAENKVILLNKPLLLEWLPTRDLVINNTNNEGHNITAAESHSHGHAHTHEELLAEPSSGYSSKNIEKNNRKDLHFWLDPQNALKTIEIITRKLKSLDPANSEIYQNNYENLRNKINTEIILIKEQLRSLIRTEPNKEESSSKSYKKYLVLHDAYQYFEKFFEIASPIGYFYDNNHNIVGFKTINNYLNIIKINNKEDQLKEPLSCIISNRKKDNLIENFKGQATPIKIVYIEPTGQDIDIKAKENGYILLLRNMSAGFQQCFSQY